MSNQKNITYTKTLSEPWFSLIKLGLKTVEGRLDKGDFSKIKNGDIIEFTNNDFEPLRKFTVKIISIEKYKTFEKYIKSEGLSLCLPGIDTIKQGVNVYYKYFTKEDETKYGIVAIRFKIM